MRRARLICIALALALLLSGCGAGANAPEKPVTTLWLFAGEPFADALAALADDYNAAAPEREVVLRVFESENALAAAMNDTRPDLLLCAGERAFALFEQGKLAECAPEAALGGAFLELDESVGRAYFPLGAETTVLAVNAAAYLASPVTRGAGDAALGGLETLCSLAAAHGRSTGQPFLAAASWAGLFESALRAAGEDFTPDFNALGSGERSAALYNALAEAAFARGLYVGAEEPGELLRKGAVVCALLPSRQLTQDAEGLACYPAPRSVGEKLVPVRTWGLAVTAADEAERLGAQAFLSWLLQPERAAELAFDEGMLPAVPLEPAAAEPGSLEEALRLTLEGARLYRAAGDGEAYAAFDERLRAALAILG